jgi:hypothetical protein
MKLQKAMKVYDLLVSIGGANEHERTDFVYHHCYSSTGCNEWRFRGKLGFGGKYRSSWNGVTYYPEDETPEKIEVAKNLNEELKKL